MQSNTKHNKFTKMGQFVLIAFNERELQIEDETHYQYDSAKVPLCSSRDEVISALVKIKYPTFDKEIAAIQNGGEDVQAHSDCRVTAKLIANEFVVFRDAQNEL